MNGMVIKPDDIRSRHTGMRLLLLSALAASLVFLTACNSSMVREPGAGVAQVPVEVPADRRQLVLGVQRMLQQKGFDPGPVDGLEGPATRSALSRFQGARGLPKTGGVNADAYRQLALDGRSTAGSGQYSNAAEQMRNDSEFINQSYLEACGVGIAGGVLIGYLTGGDSDARKKNMLVGAGVGCVAAMGANYWLQGERKQAAYKEADMQQMLSTLQDENRKLSSLVNSSRDVVAEDRRKIQQIDSAYRSKQISLDEAKRQMAEVDENQAHLEKTLANLEERKRGWDKLSSEVRSKQSSADTRAMDAEIVSLERKISVLKAELSSLEDTRRVSAIG